MDAGLIDENLEPTEDLTEAGAVIGTCVGGAHDDLLAAHTTFEQRGPGRVPPLSTSCFRSISPPITSRTAFGMQGHSSTVNTACATGSQAIGDAFHAVKFGKARS